MTTARLFRRRERKPRRYVAFCDALSMEMENEPGDRRALAKIIVAAVLTGAQRKALERDFRTASKRHYRVMGDGWRLDFAAYVLSIRGGGWRAPVRLDGRPKPESTSFNLAVRGLVRWTK